ncbi:MAG: hypothetical protein WCL00_14530 [Bacteroidota bacterium]
MKHSLQLGTNDAVDNRLEISNHRMMVPKSKLLSGSVSEKYPVLLDDGKTVVYISDKSRENEIKLRYASRK